MPDPSDLHGRVIAPVPRVTVQAFCETSALAESIEAASGDRRMQKAHVKVQMGGMAAALEAFRHAPTPNVVMIEFGSERGQVLDALDQLASVCDPGTKVVLVGGVNDVTLYRELIRRGVSEYLMLPLDVLDIVRAVSDLYAEAGGGGAMGRTIAVTGAKGGVGASTVAHNLAWTIAQTLTAQTVLVDLDIAFGTAGLDFNQDPPQSIAEAVFAPDRLDANLVDRLLSRCSDHLSLLVAPAMLDRTVDVTETAFDGLVDILRASVPTVVYDLPHVWTAWSKRLLLGADEIVIVATPDLASLRNAKNLVDLLSAGRPNDAKPRIVVNQAGTPKRPEIAPAEFVKGTGGQLAVTIPFDAALFGTAANNGQMVAEVQAGGKTTELFAQLATALTGRQEPKRPRAALLQPLMAKFQRRKAS